MNADIPRTIDITLNDRLLRISEVAYQINISRSLAYRLVQAGEIPSVRIGPSVRVRVGDLDEFIQRSWSGWKPN